jgi:hypothetical protein
MSDDGTGSRLAHDFKSRPRETADDEFPISKGDLDE